MFRSVTRGVFLTSLFMSALVVAACGDEGGSTSSTTGTGGAGGAGGGEAASFTLNFEGRVGKTPFTCAGTWPGLGSAATEVTITDFRLYVHDVKLLKDGGEEVPLTLTQDGLWQHQDLALLDFEDKTGACANGTTETNKVVRGEAPPGTYTGVAFKLGVPFALNHGDAATAPSPLNLSGLFWSWNSGYKFLRVDSVPAGGGEPFNLHLGSTGCMGDFADGGVSSCDRPNVAQIVLTGFDPTKNKIVVDYAAVIADNDLSKDQGGAPGCMSGPEDPECGPIFDRIGIDPNDGSLHPDAQKLFSVE